MLLNESRHSQFGNQIMLLIRYMKRYTNLAFCGPTDFASYEELADMA